MGTDIAVLELSDDQIIKTTKQFRSDTGTQWKYTLPSGRVVSSEVMREPNTQAIITWCQAIREQHLADAENERDKVRQARMEQMAQEKRDQTGLLVDSKGEVISELTTLPIISAQPKTSMMNQQTSLDPTAFLKTQVQTATQRVQELEQQAQIVLANLAQAQILLAEWQRIAGALSLPSSKPLPSAPTIVPDAATTGKKKRGRPPKLAASLA